MKRLLILCALLATIYGATKLPWSATTEQYAYEAGPLSLSDAQAAARAGYPIAEPYASLEKYVDAHTKGRKQK